jgi:hypothetical protein
MKRKDFIRQLSFAFTMPLIPGVFSMAAEAPQESFADKQLSVPVGGGFMMDNY